MKMSGQFILACLFTTMLLAGANAQEEQAAQNAPVYPVNLLKLDPRFSHHVLIVEKSTHQIHLYESDNGRPKFIRSFVMATGKATGDKAVEGDLKTPEGIYYIQEFKSDKDLVQLYGKEGEIYGIGAFVLNYPNVIDLKKGKTGGGIWFHGTNDASRVTKGFDSRGCVVSVNSDVKQISQYIELKNTPMVIVQDLHLVTEKTWLTIRNNIEQLVNNWLQSWKNEDLVNYISHYSPNEFNDASRGNFSQFKHYKKAVFAGEGVPSIHAKNISILNFTNYAIIQFEQHYASKKINDTGRKTLYIKKDKNYNWKIVAEIWNKLPPQTEMAFRPEQRYFAN